jgi:hypothetical protein
LFIPERKVFYLKYNNTQSSLIIFYFLYLIHNVVAEVIPKAARLAKLLFDRHPQEEIVRLTTDFQFLFFQINASQESEPMLK